MHLVTLASVKIVIQLIFNPVQWNSNLFPVSIFTPAGDLPEY